MNKMNPNDYLFKSIKDKDEEYFNMYEEHLNKEIITLLLFLGFSIASLASLALALPFAIAAGSVAATIAVHKYISTKKFDIAEDRIGREKKHLNKLLDKEPDVDERLMEKRRSKISALSFEKMNTTRKYFDANDITYITYAVTIIGGIAVLANPVCSWIPLVGIASSIIAANNEVKKYRKDSLVENRINNLEKDLELIDLITDEKGNLVYEVKQMNLDNSHEKEFIEEYKNDISIKKETNKVLKKVR